VAAGHRADRPVVVKLANSGRASDITRMRQNQQLALSKYMLPTALKSDLFIALHETINEELVAAGVSQERIVNVVNGVEVEQLAAKTDYMLHHPGRIIYVGRLHPQKSLDILLRAFDLLLQQYDKPVCLQLVGDGPISSDLSQLAIQLRIHDQVEFLGKRDDVPKLLADSDIFVLPSSVEGLSNALLEAMACGLPAIASDIPGNAEVIRDDWNGLLFPTGDADSLAKCMMLLLENMDSRQRLGRSARNTVEQNYSLDNIADRYISLYRELINVRQSTVEIVRAMKG
jgi:glycosyltransferase involved in cell wall biosynthesis